MKKCIFAALIILSACKKDGTIDMTPINVTGDILFLSARIPNSSDWQIFLMDADGTNQRLISDKSVLCTAPILSHNGRKIAFTTYDGNLYYNLYVVDIDGQNETFLSRARQYCGDPAWSPDDSRIAFVKNDDQSGGSVYDIYSIKTDGSDEMQLTNEGKSYAPQYVPGNNTIIFASPVNGWNGIYKMDADGGNKVLLTPQGRSFGNPTISPNGNLVSITSIDWEGSQIFVMNADGSNLKQLTFTVSSQYFDTGFPREGNNDPVWSPSGNKLAYVSFENGSPDVFVINANGTGNKRLTNTPLRDEAPVWTRDGNYILFSSNRSPDRVHQVYIMRPEGQLQTAITNYFANNVYPTYVDQ